MVRKQIAVLGSQRKNMNHSRLKKFTAYMDRVTNYANACGLSVEYRKVIEDGMYVPARRKIVLDSELDETTELATLLHELGHSLDDSLYTLKIETKIDKAYKKYYANKASKKEKAAVIRCERRAWFFARVIAKRLRIPLGVWFDKEQADALKCYRKG